MEQQKKFESAQEELDALRTKVSELESVSSDRQQGEIIREALKAHMEQVPDQVLGDQHKITPEKREERLGQVSAVKTNSGDDDNESEASHQEQINELLQIAEEDGILNAVSIVRDLDPHLEDDFHDALVKYFQENNFASK